jgi:O-antigen/teichoic acid export membrane protein
MKEQNIFKSFSFMGTATALGIPAAIFITVLLAKYLSPKELGYVLTGEAFVELFSFFFVMGFNNSVLKIASDSHKKFKVGLRIALGNAILIRFLVAIPISLVIIALAFITKFDWILIKCIISFTLVELFQSFTNIFGVIRRALDQYRLIAFLSLFNQVLRLIVIYVVFNFIGHLDEFLIAIVFTGFIKFLLSFISTSKLCPPIYKLSSFWPLLRESFFYGIFDYMELAQNKIDRLFLSSMLGPSAVAFYSIPSKFNRFIKIALISVRKVFLPKLHQYSKDPEKTQDLNKKLFLLLASIGLSVALGIYFFSKPVLSLLFSKDYTEAIELAPLFAFISMIWFLETTPSLILAVKGSHRARNLIQLGSLVINISLNLILIPLYGIPGAIWATITANFLRLLAFSYKACTPLKNKLQC